MQHGLATIYRRASDYPRSFMGFNRTHLAGVEELPLGCTVLLLPLLPEDIGWAPVVYVKCAISRRACFTWVHPDCIQMMDTRLDGIVEIGHVEERGDYEPSHPHLRSNQGPGVGRYEGRLHLDARWKDNYHDQNNTTCCAQLVACNMLRTAGPLLADSPIEGSSW